MVVPDHASPVAPRNHSLTQTTAANSSQTRTRATMLTLTSHYSATKTKHPRHAPCSRRGLGVAGFGGDQGRPDLRGASCPPSNHLTATTGPTSPLAERVCSDFSGSMFHRAGQSRLDVPSSRPRAATGEALGRAGRELGRGGTRAGRAQPGWAMGMIAEAVNNHSCSDIRARNRTRFANVSMGTDSETRGRPPVPGAVR
jgi:hypothetical protein